MKTRPFLSGHCTPGNPPEIHDRCRGGANGGRPSVFKPCSCPHHDAPREAETVTTTTTDVRAPGIYSIPAEEYHASPGMSASRLKGILPPNTPAHFKHAPPFSSKATDFGTIVHSMRFDAEPAWVLSPYDAFRSNEAKAWRDEQLAAGRVIAKQEDVDQARAMVEALNAHPAAELFTDGKPEQSLFWTDAETGIPCRARYDYLRDVKPGRRLIIPDLKTARTAARPDFAKAAADLGYAISAAFYIEAAVALDLDPDPRFVLVVQEKTEPYLVDAFPLHDYDLEHARDLIRFGMRLYAECLANDSWPGYPLSDEPLELPTYHRFRLDELLHPYEEIV